MKRTSKIYSLAKGLAIISIGFLMSCNSVKSYSKKGIASEKLSAKQVIKQHEKQKAEFKTLQAKVRIDIINNDKSQGSTFNIRIKKDEVIWLSAKLGLARMMITPDKVKFYSKLDNEYFDGDYKLLSDFVGVDLDFKKVQNILLGESLTHLNPDAFSVFVNDNTYALHPTDQKPLLELFYLIHPAHFKMQSLQLSQQLQKRMLQVDYSAYQKVKNEILPQQVRVVAVEDDEQVSIEMEFKSISINQDLRFPFNIPSGYKEIVLK